MAKETSDKGLGQSPDALPGTPELRGRIETALQNPELLRVLKLLVDNQDDPEFLGKVGDFAENELRGRESAEGAEYLDKETRGEFFKRILRNKQTVEIAADGPHIFTIAAEDRSNINPVKLTENQLSLLESGCYFYAKMQKCGWGKTSPKELSQKESVWFESPSGNLIVMLIKQDSENVRYSLHDCSVVESVDEKSMHMIRLAK